MELRIIAFGGLRQLMQGREHPLELDPPANAPATVQHVLEALCQRFPALRPQLDSLAVAVDNALVPRDWPITPGQEICLLPPVSGGSADPPGRGTGAQDEGGTTRWLCHQPLDLEALLAETRDVACGALVVFSGDVRDDPMPAITPHGTGEQDGDEAGRVTGIDYEAHEPMAARVLAELERQCQEHFGARQCRIQHRLGHVPLGEASVLVVVRAPHRPEAFKAARHAIDALKIHAPIWKQEHSAHGQSRYLPGVPIEPLGPLAAPSAQEE